MDDRKDEPGTCPPRHYHRQWNGKRDRFTSPIGVPSQEEEGRSLSLGCGVDVIYPPENRNLFKRIIDQGAVLSEFPMGSPPEGGHFPKRNRIISGLSIGVVVVQAGMESGSLITANYALEQGREVFAVPGNVGAESSRGTHQLIKDGAKLVESSEDILEEILPQWRKERETPSGRRASSARSHRRGEGSL